jgi:hypothetical protein
MAVTVKKVVFWDVTPCESCENRHFRRTHCLRHQGDNNRRVRNYVSSKYQPKDAPKKYVTLILRK